MQIQKEEQEKLRSQLLLEQESEKRKKSVERIRILESEKYNKEKMLSKPKSKKMQLFMTPPSNTYEDSNQLVSNQSFDEYYNPNNSYSMNTKSLAKKKNYPQSEFKSVQKQKYKKILMKYDMQRDHRLSQAQRNYQDSQKLPYWKRISMDDYEQEKITIEWDVAWQIFDEVNEHNDITKHIDLNCLDINEAVNITKQQVYQIAKDLKPYKQSYFCNGNPPADHEVLSIKCAEDHIVDG